MMKAIALLWAIIIIASIAAACGNPKAAATRDLPEFAYIGSYGLAHVYAFETEQDRCYLMIGPYKGGISCIEKHP